MSSYYEKVGSNNLPIAVPFHLPSKWVWCRLGTYCLPQFKQIPEGEFDYIDIDALDNKWHRIAQLKTLKADRAPSRAQRMVFAESTVFSMVRPYLENIALVGEKNKDCIASTGFYVCTPVEGGSVRSLFYTLLSPYVVQTINASMKGDNSPAVRKEDMESLLVPVASLPEQKRIAHMLDTLLPLLEMQCT